ncbi:unnamed protein product [Cuscuta campestris]|uniref:SET domain-containing protein n=1 Tax=Cuscuta campestris TaxID=132261 RepID=A0A484MUJ1_9ASTE|nr:unnamed protein product [Cuscuta campestris]
MKRFFSYKSDHCHKTPPNPKHQKVDISKSPEYFEANFEGERRKLRSWSNKVNRVPNHIDQKDDDTSKSPESFQANFEGKQRKLRSCSNKVNSVPNDIDQNADATSKSPESSKADFEGKQRKLRSFPNKVNSVPNHIDQKAEDTSKSAEPFKANFEGKQRKLRSWSNKVNTVPTDEHSSYDCRKQVLDVLQNFKDMYNKLLDESKADPNGGIYAKRGVPMRVASLLQRQQKWIQDKPTFGSIPGVDIGDTFQFRAELIIVGLHLQYLACIDYIDLNGEFHATSIVDSGHSEFSKIRSLDTLIYVCRASHSSMKKVEDQKLEKDQHALKNSKDAKLPIRVTCLRKTLGMDGQGYTYVGLYIVNNYKQERNQRGKLEFKFELCRLPGQQNLALPVAWDWEVVEPTQGDRDTHNVVVVDDVSQGKEKFPIPVMNSIDAEKPPPFTYITKMIKPSWIKSSLPKGCNCKNGCSNSKQCFCTRRNGGEVPYNNVGAILRAKPIVYECGPSCKCPPSCKNRVSQNGLRYHFEVFKTKSRGWGVRSRDHISSGSFICEYIGELLDEKQAEKRIDRDEYLFDIGNYDVGEDIDIDEIQRNDSEGFTIDAALFGNVGRFFNHSCSPNLYAQNILFDHDDKRVPHLVLFAQEDIPPFEELTYDYNYKIDQVRDSNGNLKKKDCYCGVHECTRRMY